MRRRPVSQLAGTLRRCAAAACVALAMGALPSAGWAQDGPSWSELTSSQRASLKPLERDWSHIDPERKEKWLEIAGRMPKMPPQERARIQARMSAWTGLSQQERDRARMAYQEAKQVSPRERQAQWEAYQALSPERKQQLADRAAPVPRAPRSKANGNARKSNIVPNPAYADPPRQVAPTVLQARPGATTTLISRRPAPPAHQQAGLPKIAGTPEFVDKSTLLPRRGAQGAAAASAPARPTRQR